MAFRAQTKDMAFRAQTKDMAFRAQTKDMAFRVQTKDDTENVHKGPLFRDTATLKAEVSHDIIRARCLRPGFWHSFLGFNATLGPVWISHIGPSTRAFLEGVNRKF